MRSAKRSGMQEDRDTESVDGSLRRTNRASSVVGRLILILPLAFLVLFFFYPLASILVVSLAPDGKLDLQAITALVAKPHFLRVLWFTFWQAAVSTILTLALALPGAFIFARYEFPGKAVVQALTTVPFVMPTVVVAMAFTALLGPRGLVNSGLMRLLRLARPPLDLQYTLAAILLAHIFYNYAVVLRIVSGYWANLDPRLAEAARMLGASRWRAFRQVTLPLLAPAVTAATVLVFMFCFTSFGVVLILGGPRFATLEVEIYRQTIQYLNLPVAAALSVIQILFTLVLMVVYTRLQARVSRPVELRPRQTTQRRPRRWSERLMIAANVALMTALLVLPLATLVGRSLVHQGKVSMESYTQLLSNPRDSVLYVPPAEAIRNSLGFALATTVLAVALGLMAASVQRERSASPGWARRVVDPIFMLPLGASAVTLGLGYIVALDQPPLNLRTSPVLIVLAHTLVAMPFVVRSVSPALRSISPRLREAATSLGASPWRVWREIDMPIVARATLVGAVFAFTISMGEFGATSLIARPDRPTMPVAIYRLLARPGATNYAQALAMAALLMLVCTLGFLAIERLRIGRASEF